MPIGTSQKRVVEKLFRDAEDYDTEMENAEFSVDIPIDGPYLVVDPRRVGFNYLSYVFIESGKELPDIDNNGGKITKDFQNTNLTNGLLIGLTLGDFDMVHRRVEKEQYRHAKFAVESINNKQMDYLEGMETYPVWAIARWHGQNIPEARMFNDENFEDISPFKADILYELMKYPHDEPEDIAARIEHRVGQDESESAITDPEDLPGPLVPEVSDTIDTLQNNNIILGESIRVNVSEAGYKHGIIGVNVTEIEKGELEEEKSNLDDAMGRDPLPNEVIMQRMKKVFDDPWQVPYIVSGVGQDWADILVEIHLDDVQNMDKHAGAIREIPGVKSTRTHLVTHEVGNQPLEVHDPEYFETSG